MDFKVSLYAPIYQQFWLEILNFDICAMHDWKSSGERLASVCSVSVNDVPNGVSGIFLAHFPDLMKGMVWFKKAETEDVVKGLDEFAQRLDVVAAVIFTLIDIKGESLSKQH